MDPYMMMSSRILHEERVADSLRRHTYRSRELPVVGRQDSVVARAFARLAALVAPRSLEKRSAS
jgi:hypothetical protein